MSNALALAAVTAALRHFIGRTVQEDVPLGVNVVAGRPPIDPPDDPTITIFLYQLTPNGALRNSDAPTRAVDGTPLRRAQAAVDLHYVISCYGSEEALVPQRLLGSVVRSLYDEPLLSVADIDASTATAPFLAGSDLAASRQRVRFTPNQLDLDDMSRLWQMLGQTPYGLSVCYQATAVLLDGRTTPAGGLPVLDRRIVVAPITAPAVERVLSAVPGGAPDTGPVTADRDLVLVGTGLARPGMTARVGGLPAAVLASSERRVVVGQPAELPPGAHPVQLLYDVAFGDRQRPLVESNVVAYVRRPRITRVTSGASGVTVQLDLSVLAAQRAVLLLDGAGGRGYRFDAPHPLAEPGVTTDRFTVPITGVEPGTYLVRVQIDGAQSPLELTGGTFSGPTVEV
ncbi:DUF4255 domain-containing protein [Catenuloplanes atrovinosus]|uniref:Pvc16 N-terminal domain-containing protein n=1 Tax=Catenuloplanes atrovinosus TaxID=137266 RepID=A0AAE3YNL3_9ACTN|nr:DUF4255 domain-containing protein [Catenuloplanes atrovinosus]MDR7275508.1 hypothetical protein [Catenuloplanes atrovinosus]